MADHAIDTRTPRRFVPSLHKHAESRVLVALRRFVDVNSEAPRPRGGLDPVRAAATARQESVTRGSVLSPRGRSPTWIPCWVGRNAPTRTPDGVVLAPKSILARERSSERMRPVLDRHAHRS